MGAFNFDFATRLYQQGTVLHISVNNSRFYGCKLVKLALPRCPGHNTGTVCTDASDSPLLFPSLVSSWCTPRIYLIKV